MPHTFANLVAHVVFSTKDRRTFLKSDLRGRLFPYLGGIVRESGGTALLINGPEDHVHILLSLPPTVALSDVMRVAKANSSKWVHETWGDLGEFGWQAGFGAFSVSQSNVDAVKRYILEQEEHHRKMTFQEEFVALLTKHNISYDPRYIWE